MFRLLLEDWDVLRFAKGFTAGSPHLNPNEKRLLFQSIRYSAVFSRSISELNRQKPRNPCDLDAGTLGFTVPLVNDEHEGTYVVTATIPCLDGEPEAWLWLKLKGPLPPDHPSAAEIRAYDPRPNRTTAAILTQREFTPKPKTSHLTYLQKMK